MWNLLGRALGAVVTCAAATLKIPRTQVLQGAGVTLLGASSLKAAMDIDWGDPAAQADALARLLAEVDRVEAWVAAERMPSLGDPEMRHGRKTRTRLFTG